MLELHEEIENFKRRERAFIVYSHFKDKANKHYEKELKEVKKNREKSESERKVFYTDPLLRKEFKVLKNLIREKDELIQKKDEELSVLEVKEVKWIFK